MNETENSPATDQVRPRQLHLEVRSDRLLHFGLLVVAVGLGQPVSVPDSTCQPLGMIHVSNASQARLTNCSTDQQIGPKCR